MQIDKPGCGDALRLVNHFSGRDVRDFLGGEDLVNLSLFDMQDAVSEPLKGRVESTASDQNFLIILDLHSSSPRALSRSTMNENSTGCTRFTGFDSSCPSRCFCTHDPGEVGNFLKMTNDK